mmetsp:Transcript_2609/g.11443  ORF Transcript_2609/g.11443 Transcript_2609/m.11443 type:complete len:213 (-) Transcript_2609:53-691(-)
MSGRNGRLAMPSTMRATQAAIIAPLLLCCSSDSTTTGGSTAQMLDFPSASLVAPRFLLFGRITLWYSSLSSSSWLRISFFCSSSSFERPTRETVSSTTASPFFSAASSFKSTAASSFKSTTASSFTSTSASLARRMLLFANREPLTCELTAALPTRAPPPTLNTNPTILSVLLNNPKPLEQTQSSKSLKKCSSQKHKTKTESFTAKYIRILS